MVGMLAMIVCIALVSPVAGAGSLRDNQLFAYTSLEVENVDDRQRVERILGTILSKPTTAAVDLIRIDSDLLSLLASLASGSLQGAGIATLDMSGTPVNLTLPSGRLVEFDKINVERSPSSGLFISGSNTEDIAVGFSLIVGERTALGGISAESGRYFVSSLEGSLHALVRLDMSQFRNPAPPLDPGWSPRHQQ